MKRSRRLRIFAGPNGSGKSTLFEEFNKIYDPGIFINADEIERKLSSTGFIDLSKMGLKISNTDFEEFKKSKDSKSLFDKANQKRNPFDIEFKDNFIIDKSKKGNSYAAAYIATFIRHLLIKNNKSFSYETVMSHPSKLKEIQTANNRGYKIYLYFVCTDNPEINITRVENRVDKGGHDVDYTKIISRYHLTLGNLSAITKIVHRAYFFDNSGKKIELLAEAFEGKLFKIYDRNNIPDWFKNNMLDKIAFDK